MENRIEEVSSNSILELTGLRCRRTRSFGWRATVPTILEIQILPEDKPRALQDPAAITLTEYLRVLRDLRPKAFLIENVPGLIYEVHKEASDLVFNTAAALGYSVTHRVVNAADYGVPQIRERLFIVGTAQGAAFEFPPVTHSQQAGEDLFTQPWRTAGDVLADLDTEEAADDTGHYAGGKYHNLLEQIPPGDNYLFFTKERGHPEPVFIWRSRYWSFLLKLSPHKPSWTIQARRSNNMGPLHWRNRILRIEEIKRLQTFPDDWQLFGKTESVWRQVGNAVPPVLGEVLGRRIAEMLSKAELKESPGRRVAIA